VAVANFCAAHCAIAKTPGNAALEAKNLVARIVTRRTVRQVSVLPAGVSSG
jgi:hypothetical protein